MEAAHQLLVASAGASTALATPHALVPAAAESSAARRAPASRVPPNPLRPVRQLLQRLIRGPRSRNSAPPVEQLLPLEAGGARRTVGRRARRARARSLINSHQPTSAAAPPCSLLQLPCGDDAAASGEQTGAAAGAADLARAGVLQHTPREEEEPTLAVVAVGEQRRQQQHLTQDLPESRSRRGWGAPWRALGRVLHRRVLRPVGRRLVGVSTHLRPMVRAVATSLPQEMRVRSRVRRPHLAVRARDHGDAVRAQGVGHNDGTAAERALNVVSCAPFVMVGTSVLRHGRGRPARR